MSHVWLIKAAAKHLTGSLGRLHSPVTHGKEDGQYTLKRSYCGGIIASKVKKHVKSIRAKQELFHPTDENTVSALISQVLVIASQGPNAFRLVHVRFPEVKKSQPKHFTDGFHVGLGLSSLREEVPGIRGK